MMQAALSLDLVEELQLRRWAREHFVPSGQRDAGWHPVIHEEMDRKEEELLAEYVDPIGGRYVPLPIEAPGMHARHEMKPPRFLASQRRVEELHYT